MKPVACVLRLAGSLVLAGCAGGPAATSSLEGVEPDELPRGVSDASTDGDELAAPPAAAAPAEPTAEPGTAPAEPVGARDRRVVLYEPGAGAALEARAVALGGVLESRHDDAGLATVTGLDDAAAAQLRELAGVTTVETDVAVRLRLTDEPGTAATATGDAPSARAGAAGGAAFLARQWHLRAMRADAAWAAGHQGRAGVTVAVLDTGVDYTHADLAGRVDLARSVSFVPSDDALVRRYFPGRHPVSDLHYHGTHVAATVSSNGVLAAGVTSRVTLVGVKVLSATGSGSLAGILRGLAYATDAGADVINLSLGTTFDRAGAGWVVGALNRAVNYAHRRGATVVVAAGNDAADLDHDGNSYNVLCSAPNVLCVGATGPAHAASPDGPYTDLDAPAPYSNFGRSAITVAAPGGARAPVWAACSTTSLRIPVCRNPGRNYIVGLAGTSMAAPHVAGLAALLASAAPGRARPAQIRGAIQRSADDLGARGVDPHYGRGRINAARALGVE